MTVVQSSATPPITLPESPEWLDAKIICAAARRLRLNLSSQLDLCKATDGRRTTCWAANAFFRVSVRDQTQNLFIERTQIPIN
jgi:hypothetical protein